MFDTLVESSSHGKESARMGGIVLGTATVFIGIVFAAVVYMILNTQSGLMGALDVTTMIAPPPPPAAPPPPAQQTVARVIPEITTFTPPTKPPEKIPDPTSVQSRPVVSAGFTGVPGGVPGGVVGGVPGGVAGGSGDAPPPPPKQIKVSGGVLQGSALRRVQPQYPPIAKAARAAGAVQVQVTISEEGRVIEAQVVSGHPLLRDAAVQAARQWLFKPTELSGVPVKVQGVLTFNFTLQ